MGLVAVGLLAWLILRRRRRPIDVIHDIQRLEKETVLKESELLKTIQAAKQMENSIESQVQHQQDLESIQQQIAAQQPGPAAAPSTPSVQPPATPGADFLHSDQRQPPPA